MPAAQLFTADGRAAVAACVCPACGTVTQRQPGRECEELACPRCGSSLKSGFFFVGASPAAGGFANPPPAPAPAPLQQQVMLTPDLRERMLDHAVATPPGPLPAPLFAPPASRLR